MSEIMSCTIKFSHGDLGCSWRSHLSVEFNTLMPHYLGPKGFYPGRDKSGLGSMI
jgi:hypothetical protein